MRDNRGRFLPGTSGNVRGRPRSGQAISDLLRQKLDRNAFSEALIDMAMNKGIDPDVRLRAMKLILAYTDGAPRNAAEIESEGGIQIQVTYVQNNRVEITRPALGPTDGDSGSEAIQRSLLRAPMGEDSPGA